MNIYYFSGTGNTKRIAKYLSEQLMCEMKPIGSYEKDMIIMYPIYAFSTPQNVLEWISSLPRGNGKIVIIKTAADFIRINKMASSDVIRILEKKGYTVVYDRIVVMPSNFMVAYPDSFIIQLDSAARRKVQQIAVDLNQGLLRLERKMPLVKLLSIITRVGERYCAKKFFSKSLRTKESCMGCQKCVRECPVGNIVYEHKVIFLKKCIWCMKCIYNCPVSAIYSKGFQFTILKDGYNLDKVLTDSFIEDVYVTNETKGYYKHFIKYLKDDSI